ncbi:MAG TPA: hypothetical protein VD905_06695 [Flavobacteriales bacterium]|nr:hypothetical protein [Flavobacteriales bacterium]
MKSLLPIVLFLCGYILQAQECFIDESFSPKQFKNNKVKTVKVTQVEKDSVKGRLVYTYELSRNNLFTKGLRHSVQGYLETFCTWSKDSTHYVMTINSIDVENNLVFPIKRITREYNKKRQLLMHSHEELMGNYSRHIVRFNPDDTTETYIETIGMQGTDTVGHSINKQNSKGFFMISRERVDGKLTVRKQVVTYKNGMVDQHDEYENGKLINSRKGFPDEVAIVRMRVDPESKNSLPYRVFEYNDTLTIDASEVPPEYLKCLPGFKEKKLKMIIKYFRPNKLETYGVDYLYMNGLPLISHNMALNYFNVYEYEFYTDTPDPKKPVKTPVKTKNTPGKIRPKTPPEK